MERGNKPSNSIRRSNVGKLKCKIVAYLSVLDVGVYNQ
jgi:hypothetical protein